MPTFNVEFAYNTSDSVPAAGAQRQTLNVAFATAKAPIATSERDELIDYSRTRDVLGETRRLFFHLGREILKDPANRSFFRSFFKAKYRWALYDDFKDTAVSGNLCRCNPEDDEVEVTAARDAEGYWLISDKVF